MDEETKIRVCDDCGKPIIWTFAFIGAEWYCPSCGASRDMFFGKDVKSTPKLLKFKKSLAIKFGQIRPYLYMGGERNNNCDKCFPKGKEGGYHINHLTKQEREKMQWARKRLELIKS